MDAKLRTAIWDGMVETDRMARYYGYLAGKLARREKWASVATTTFGVISAYSIANSSSGSGWMWSATIFATLTVAASVVPLVFRYGGIIASAAHCQSRLDLLSQRWNTLWLSRDFVDTEEALRQWQEITKEQTEITSFQSATPIDRKLSEATRKEAHGYWKNEADRLNRLSEKRRQAIAATT